MTSCFFSSDNHTNCLSTGPIIYSLACIKLRAIFGLHLENTRIRIKLRVSSKTAVPKTAVSRPIRKFIGVWNGFDYWFTHGPFGTRPFYERPFWHLTKAYTSVYIYALKIEIKFSRLSFVCAKKIRKIYSPDMDLLDFDD